jgi:hypothetical protein
MNTTPPPAPSAPVPAQAATPNKSNLPLAVMAGAIASLVGAVVWAVVTVATEMQIGWMAVGVGFLVGFAVGRFNYSGQAHFGFIGAALALSGCLLGNVLSLLGFAASQENVSFVQVLSVVDWGKVPGAMADSFSPMDILFYGIAIYQGYKFGLKPRQA